MRLTELANENKIFIVGLFAVHIGTNAMIPLLTGFAKDPDDGAVGLKAALLPKGAKDP